MVTGRSNWLGNGPRLFRSYGCFLDEERNLQHYFRLPAFILVEHIVPSRRTFGTKIVETFSIPS